MRGFPSSLSVTRLVSPKRCEPMTAILNSMMFMVRVPVLSVKTY